MRECGALADGWGMCRIADAVVDEGLELLLSLPKALGIQTALAVVFVGLALIPSALAKIAALPSPTLARFVAAAVEPLSGSEDPAKKSAAVFMVNAICQPAILAAFDELKGLRRVLAALSNTMLLLKQTGGRQEKQVKVSLVPWKIAIMKRRCIFQHRVCSTKSRGKARQAE